MSIRAVFFDLDDTLMLTTATRPERARLCAEALLPHGNGMNIDELMSRMLAPNPDGFPVGAEPVIDELRIADLDAARQAIGI